MGDYLGRGRNQCEVAGEKGVGEYKIKVPCMYVWKDYDETQK
jgi:hypothetical protein